ncbi:hypothetical protein [Faecalimonas sp.]
MKDLFENIVDKIGETAETVGKKAGEVVEVQKIKGKIRTLERNNRRDFRDLGRMIYERYQNGEIQEGEFFDLCENISERDEEIKVCEAEIQSIVED